MKGDDRCVCGNGCGLGVGGKRAFFFDQERMPRAGDWRPQPPILPPFFSTRLPRPPALQIEQNGSAQYLKGGWEEAKTSAFGIAFSLPRRKASASALRPVSAAAAPSSTLSLPFTPPRLSWATVRARISAPPATSTKPRTHCPLSLTFVRAPRQPTQKQLHRPLGRRISVRGRGHGGRAVGFGRGRRWARIGGRASVVFGHVVRQ